MFAVSAAAALGSSQLSAPLYVAWQLTNECNLACLHCIEESGPGKAFPDELDGAQCLEVLEGILAAKVPYLCFSGGEPMSHPRFWELCERATASGVGLKVETNGHALDAAACARLKRLGVQSVQISLDGTGPASYGRLRVHGSWERALSGVRELREAGVEVEVNFSPTRFNVGEVGRAIDLARSLGVVGFYTGRTIRAGNAAKSWELIAPTEEQYREYFSAVRAKAAEHEGRMRVCFHELGLIEELKYRLENPAAILIILPNGKVKLINALPFVCGDLRRQPLGEVWAAFQRGWKDPRVAAFVADLEKDPTLIRKIHEWVEL